MNGERLSEGPPHSIPLRTGREVGRELPRISPFLMRWFTWYARRFVRRHFHSLRIATTGLPPTVNADQSLVIAMNHPGWWDPLIALLIAQHYWPERKHFAPIDAAMLKRYAFFAKLGFFGVEQGTTSGGSAFLRTALSIVKTPGTCLWITAQGRFTDPRERPICFAPGLAHLLKRVGESAEVIVVPMAIEYPFWTERDPEALLRFGAAATKCEDVEALMESTMNALSADAISKEPARFSIVESSTSGTSAIYDAWRRIRHMFSRERGERFDPAHMEKIES